MSEEEPIRSDCAERVDTHETLRVEETMCTNEVRRWLNKHGARRTILSMDDPLYRWGVAQHRRSAFAMEPGDTLCWDGTHVWLHSSRRQEVETCKAKEARMLKFGTGQITVPDDREDTPITRTAARLTDAERAAILDEGELETTEGE
ncbi:hypothetical protein [Streptomyces albidoflavus]|uniref:hypothetical protein n=1 Tax=Streptomyces albidoflavus TaxID=1886 RepID=UPI003403B9CE